jgi:hypothetical protein
MSLRFINKNLGLSVRNIKEKLISIGIKTNPTISGHNFSEPKIEFNPNIFAIKIPITTLILLLYYND